MEEVYHDLFVGGDEDYEKTKDSKGWAFLRCCKYGDGSHQQLLSYHTLAAPEGKNKYIAHKGNLMALNLLDLHDPHYINSAMIEDGLEFIKEQLAGGNKVLVACNHGHSRGPSIALLYMRSIGELPYSLGMSERVFSALYPNYSPKQGIRQYVRMHWSDWVKEHDG